MPLASSECPFKQPANNKLQTPNPYFQLAASQDHPGRAGAYMSLSDVMSRCHLIQAMLR